jgi:1,4-dihydroxy-2-naphthoate octaprenyltransferase
VSSPALWIAGARPRTLPAAIAPVLVGTALVGSAWIPTRATLALVVALALQVGVNYANDYSDGVKGTDRSRVGPVRLVGQGLVQPRAVRNAALGCFLIAAIVGFVLVALTAQWWLLAIGASAIAAAWLYTGGPRPYGYAGLGEVFVFVYFGLVPVLGTVYVQTGSVDGAAVVAAMSVGALATAILVTNNLRDIPTDLEAGKRTLAVRLGDQTTRVLYVVLICAAFAGVAGVAWLATPWALLGLASIPWAIRPIRIVAGGAIGRDLVPALSGTGVLVAVYAVSLSLGLVIGLVLSP